MARRDTPKLDDSIVAGLRPRAKPFKAFDAHGFYLLVLPNGARYWRQDYSFGGRRKTLALGIYPDLPLAAAREKAAAARALLKDGADPMQEKRVAKLTAEFRSRQTFGLIVDELIEKMEREHRAPATLAKFRWLLRDLAAELKDRPIARITPAEILALLRRAELRGHLETARRLRAAIGQVFRLAVATDRVARDPTPDLRGAIATPRVKHRSAIVEPAEVGKLMAAMYGYDRPVMRHAMMIAAYCFPRPGELRLARWSEVDLKEAVWRIPAERHKMRREHRIPLSRQALAEFRALRRITGDPNGGLCFPGARRGRPISENTINAALRTLGFDGETHTSHGFRAMASTILNEHSEFDPDVIERALGHVEANEIRRAYHRAEYWNERVALMGWYATFLDRVRGKAEILELIG